MPDDVARAAQQSEAGGPVPTGPQHHVWHTADEYVAQVALPCHRVLAVPVVPVDGDPAYLTACGLRLGETLLRTTDVKADITCAKCKRSRAK